MSKPVQLPASSRIQLDVNTAQLQGGRPRQEDAFLVRQIRDGLIVLVADGLGGHEQGDEASRVGCMAACKSLENAQLRSRGWNSLLRKAFLSAHKAVQKIPAPHRLSPAATLVGGVISTDEGKFYCANVGDSGAWLVRDGQGRRLLEPQRDDGGVVQALGLNIDPRGSAIDITDPVVLRPGDSILLASDGIETLDPANLAELLAGKSAQGGCEALVQMLLARKAPHQDNCTLIVVGVGSTDGP